MRENDSNLLLYRHLPLIQAWNFGLVLHVPANYQRKPRTALSVSVITDDPAASSLRIPISATAAAAISSGKAISRPARLAPAPTPVNLKPRDAAPPQPSTQPQK
jgi:hypothetical protein